MTLLGKMILLCVAGAGVAVLVLGVREGWRTQRYQRSPAPSDAAPVTTRRRRFGYGCVLGALFCIPGFAISSTAPTIPAALGEAVIAGGLCALLIAALCAIGSRAVKMVEYFFFHL